MKHETQSVPEGAPPVDSVPLPCPFCGEADPAKLIVDLDIVGVICKGCEATGPCLLDQEFESDEAAIEAGTVAWNRRHGIKNGSGPRRNHLAGPRGIQGAAVKHQKTAVRKQPVTPKAKSKKQMACEAMADALPAIGTHAMDFQDRACREAALKGAARDLVEALYKLGFEIVPRTKRQP